MTEKLGKKKRYFISCAVAAGSLLAVQFVYSGWGNRLSRGVQDDGGSGSLPSHAELAAALDGVVAGADNAGFGPETHPVGPNP